MAPERIYSSLSEDQPLWSVYPVCIGSRRGGVEVPGVSIVVAALADQREDLAWRLNLTPCCQPLACPPENKTCSQLSSGCLDVWAGEWIVVPWTCCRCALDGSVGCDWDCRAVVWPLIS